MILSLLFITCDFSDQYEPPEEDNATPEAVDKRVDPEHTSRNVLDWSGVYRGTMPCADCEGIRTEVMLVEGDRFMMKQQYLGKSDSVRTYEGDLKWDVDGARITLEPDGQGEPMRLLVGERRLFKLDSDDRRIDGELAENYILMDAEFDNTLYAKYWRLESLYGDEIEHENQGRREPHLILKQQDRKVTGSTGCNTLSGTYTLVEPELIDFDSLMTTKVACPDAIYESTFIRMLNDTRIYSFNADNLVFQDSSKSEIARFSAVYFY